MKAGTWKHLGTGGEDSATSASDAVLVALIHERAAVTVARIQADKDVEIAHISAQSSSRAERTKFWAYLLTGVLVAVLTGLAAVYRIQPESRPAGSAQRGFRLC